MLNRKETFYTRANTRKKKIETRTRCLYSHLFRLLLQINLPTEFRGNKMLEVYYIRLNGVLGSALTFHFQLIFLLVSFALLTIMLPIISFDRDGNAVNQPTSAPHPVKLQHTCCLQILRSECAMLRPLSHLIAPQA